MPEDTNIDFKINPEVLEQVLARLWYACIFLYLYICSCGTPFHFTKIDFVREATKKTLDIWTVCSELDENNAISA